IMKDRDPKDPTSWLYQANIHGTTDLPMQEGWAQCQHGSFFFFPWHRMYIYYFERILRKASGNPDFALPYWNYSLPSQLALPTICRVPAEQNKNPLYVEERNNQEGINDGPSCRDLLHRTQPLSPASISPPTRGPASVSAGNKWLRHNTPFGHTASWKVS